MISIIETVTMLILTALNTFITTAQFGNERKQTREERLEKKRQAAEKDIIRDLVVYTKQVDESIDVFVNLKKALYDSEQSEDRFNEITIGARKCLDAYGVTCENISNLHKRLLINEEKFPLSRGFERYINAFRTFLMTEGAYSRTLFAYMSFKDWVREIYQESHVLQEKHVGEFNERIDKVLDGLERLGEAIYELHPYINEISIKYGCEEPEKRFA